MPSSRRLSPSKSLQKLRTAFSHSPTGRPEPTAPLSPLSTTTSASSSTSTGSPISAQEGFAGFAGFTFGGTMSSPAMSHASEEYPHQPDSRRIIRRKKSCVEIEQEQERYQFDGALVGLVEPRPRVGPTLGGIEEVLCGEV